MDMLEVRPQTYHPHPILFLWSLGLPSLVEYELEVHTGRDASAGTTAAVQVVLFGDAGNSGVQHLQNSSTHQDRFQPGHVILFALQLSRFTSVLDNVFCRLMFSRSLAQLLESWRVWKCGMTTQEHVSLNWLYHCFKSYCMIRDWGVFSFLAVAPSWFLEKMIIREGKDGIADFVFDCNRYDLLCILSTDFGLIGWIQVKGS